MNYEERYNQALERAKEKRDEYKRLDGEKSFVPSDIEYIFPELRESEDESIRKEIISFITDRKNWFPKEETKKSWIAWLEKQGEKSDKVEPKFKVGDWITNGEYIWKVTDIHPLDYILQSPNGDLVDDTIFYVDEEFHLWTIQDAKDGDILSSGNPFIFRGFGDKRHPNSPTAYCGINSEGTFILSIENDWWTANNVHPATKEQRDLLFQKMKEAGYEWDAEKKELKKIEQASTWSAEDKKYIAHIIAILEGWDREHVSSIPSVVPKCIDWLKSIKPNTRNDLKKL